MNSITREQRERVLSPKTKIPPVGHYTPNYEISRVPSKTDLKMRSPTNQNHSRILFSSKSDISLIDEPKVCKKISHLMKSI